MTELLHYISSNTKKLLLIAVWLVASSALAQIDIESNMPAELTVNGNQATFELVITNNTTAVSNVALNLTLPDGIEYVVGTVGSSTGHTVQVVNASQAKFSIQSIASLEECRVELDLFASCPAVDNQLQGTIFRNDVEVIADAQTYTHTSASYNILYPAITILDVTPKNTTIVSGDLVTRTYSIVNGGNGYTENIVMKHSTLTDVEIVSTSIGSLSGTELNLSTTDFSGVGTSSRITEGISLRILRTLSALIGFVKPAVIANE